ncbi:bifunctional adenosylcobinamide kinase/adenosylcobinamide-phosphate guanylyltransferase [Planobispora rosea]|uniref:bifunctional adenosylcobinamide kinase/adenosylcobinamide-phosphate guanylyltransferase n=1 Tax=Planobispora rosea TaxID=35762 RepID=UPI00083A726E|nr:bifunctional adenosylcobinamide kinase/adenosylcobinamide-phosphate guanylyltransferase [Planobispora rosea]
MKILFEGTAGPYGRPAPGCGCASCSRPALVRRRPARIVVDGHPLPPEGCAVVTPGGERLLYAPPGSTHRDGPEDGDVFDAVLIDLLDRPERLGGLRRRGLVGEDTHVVAVGIDHRVPSDTELERRLALWGARAVPDGTVLDAREPAPARPPQPRRTLLLGGSRSGKSAEAELRLLAEPEVVYVATGPSGGDPEWLARIRGHRERRPAHWDTVETTDLAGLLGTARAPLLIDGLGTWITAVFDECGAWEGGAAARERVDARCDELVAAWRRTRSRVVAVSDEAGLGVVPATSSGRAFRDALGRLNQRLAAESEDVSLVVAGRLLPLPI